VLFGLLAGVKLRKGATLAAPPALSLWGEAAPKEGSGGGLASSSDGSNRCSVRHGALVAGASLAAGFLKGLCGVGGPPMMVLLALGVSVDPREWRATTAATQFGLALVQLYVYFGAHQDWGATGTPEVFGAMVAGGLAGLGAGNAAAPRVNQACLQRFLTVFLATVTRKKRGFSARAKKKEKRKRETTLL
jgi:uncharacterized membrane protein YfcA